MANKIEVPEWILKLQERTWELEILVSGGAIFSLFQASEFILNVFNYIQMTMDLSGQGVILFIVMIGIKLLTLGFIFQLLLRTLWISMVFINYVYPQGAQSEKIKWKKPFKIEIDTGSDLYEPIMKTDRLSATAMYVSIISAFVLIGLIILIAVFFLFYQLFPANIKEIILQVFTYLFIIYVFDFLSFGILRKIPFVSYLFYPVFTIFDYLSLRVIYRPSLMVFSTNVKKRYAIAFLFVFTMISITSAYISVQNTFHWSNLFDRRAYRFQLADNVWLANWYEDENPNSRVSIPSKIIEKDFLEVKVTFWADDDKYMNLIDKPEDKRLFSDIVQISIDDSIYQKPKWFPFKKDSEWGIKTMIPILNLSAGEHLLVVQNTPDIVEKASKSGLGIKIVKIPFWKEK